MQSRKFKGQRPDLPPDFDRRPQNQCGSCLDWSLSHRVDLSPHGERIWLCDSCRKKHYENLAGEGRI